MQPVNQQKAIVIVAIVAVAALVATTFFSQGGVIFNLSDEEKAAIEQHQEAIRASARFAAEDNVDEQASKIFWEQHLDKLEIAEEVNSDLGFNNGGKYVLPSIDEKRVVVKDDESEQAVEKYYTEMSGIISKYQKDNENLYENAWALDPEPFIAYKLARLSENMVDDMYEVEVPRPALELHKSALLGVEAEAKYAEQNDLYIRDLLPRGGRWTGTANAFAAFQESARGLEAETQKLAARYTNLAILPDEPSGGFLEPKKAEAFLPAVPTQTVWDWPRFIREALEAGVAYGTTTYVKNKVIEFVNTTEEQFLVRNYLYYTDAVINSKYADDFLNKYVQDPKSREVIKSLLPQYSCGQVDEAKLRQTLRDEALKQLGFDPKNLDPTDVAFYEKLLKASNPDTTSAALSSDGAILFNWSLAIATGDRASGAANLELIAPGKKVPILNEANKKIAVSLDYITNKINSAMSSVFDLVLPTNSTKGYGSLAAVAISAVTDIISNLGITNLVVLKEQQTCVKAPVFNPIVAPSNGNIDIGIDQNYIRQCIQDPDNCPLIQGYDYRRSSIGFGLYKMRWL